MSNHIDEDYPERTGSCGEHIKRTNDLDNEIHKQSGWLKTSALLITISILAIGGFNGMVFSKLSVIESLLSESKVITAIHSEQIKSLDQRVNAITERNKYIDQQHGLAQGRDR